MVSLETAIEETQSVLQPLFVKPKLSKKLLTKPPFRFIHDIVVATLKSTGFPNGYFTLDELDSSNYKDGKTAKIAFLNKLISLVNKGNAKTLEVSPAKIVSGLEPLDTNVLLSTFGKLAIDKSLDHNALIQHCLAGKGIDEFQRGKSGEDVIAAEESTQGSGATLIPSDEDTNEVVATKSTKVIIPDTILEQVKACNEDIEQTREMISKIVTKPKCSDKLLSKPPFRFIHDLLVGIGKATEFDLGMIFSEDELISSNVKDKQPKLQFLEKLVNFLEVNLVDTINVKPAKIISGLEPERTRYLLQLFTVVATSKCLSSTEQLVDINSEEAAAKSKLQIEEPAKELPSDNVDVKEDEVDIPPTDDKNNILATAIPPAAVEIQCKSSLVTRPATSHGGRQQSSILRERKDKPINVVRPATAMISGKSRGAAKSTDEKEAKAHDDLGIFQKVAEQQKIKSKVEIVATELKGVSSNEPQMNQMSNTIPLPTKLSDVDFESLANTIENIAQSTAPLGTVIDGIVEDIETMIKTQKQSGGGKDLQVELNNLTETLQKQLTDMKSLEESLIRNADIRKKHEAWIKSY